MSIFTCTTRGGKNNWGRVYYCGGYSYIPKRNTYDPVTHEVEVAYPSRFFCTKECEHKWRLELEMRSLKDEFVRVATR